MFHDKKARALKKMPRKKFHDKKARPLKQAGLHQVALSGHRKFFHPVKDRISS
jgi:hypothetical protein